MKSNRSQPLRSSILFGVLATVSLAVGSPACAQPGAVFVLTLKNTSQFEGEAFTAQGYPSSEVFPLAKQDPVVVVHDGLRRTFFARARLARHVPSDRIETMLPVWQRTYQGSPGGGHVLAIGPFDENGHRFLRVRSSDGKTETFVQGITEVGPRYCVVETLNVPKAIPGVSTRMRNWSMSIGTKTIDPDILRNLLRKQIKNPASPDEYYEIVDFFVKSKQYKRAIEELRLMQQQFPALKADIAKERLDLRQLYARSVLQRVQNMIDLGQFVLAGQLIEVFGKENLAGEILAEFNDLQNQLAQTVQNVDQLRTLVAQNVAAAKSGGNLDQNQAAIADRFATEIETELSAATIARLDAFRRLFNDASMTAEQKLALAISGWVVGSNNAFDNFAIAQSLFPVRDLVIEYLTVADEGRRTAILAELAQLEGGAPEYLAQMMPLLRPLAPPDELEEYTGEQPLEFFAEVPGTTFEPEPKRFQCLVHLPVEYNPDRKYPCIITLRPNIPNEQQLNRFCGRFDPKLGIRVGGGKAMQNGFIVVAVDWALPGKSEYLFSATEHAAVLDAYRKTLRKFSVDTDRVYLSGHGEGATAAYDIGLSHPEHWAGIINIGGRVTKFAELYKENKHLSLPIYAVVGEKDRASIVSSKDSWNEWLRSANYLDLVLIEYQGRGDEPFHEELENIFEWTKSIRRILPDRNGFEIEFKSRRPWDNYFWFWEFRGIPERFVTRPELWSDRHPKPILISAELKDNQVNTFLLGPNNVGDGGTLWLSPDIVDFDQEIKIMGRGNYRGFVKPSRKVLLEDVRTRGDRQHPYWARLDCEGKTWVTPE